jgi:hypothetical protein
LNPFDILDRQTAQQIVQGTRAQGFRGEQGREIQDAIGEIYKDIGTDINETLTMLTNTIRSGSMSIKEFTEVMKGLDQTAQDSGFSVSAIQKNLATLQTTVSATGGPTASRIAVSNFPYIQAAFKGTQIGAAGLSE